MNKCLHCGTATKNPKYCGSSCAAKRNNKLYPKRKANYNVIRKTCLRCDKPLIAKQKKYCSIKCSASYTGDIIFKKWLRGEHEGSDTRGVLLPSIRLRLVQQTNYKCSECGWGKPNPVLGRPILTIEHIDGNWKNNTPDNVRVLCYNCHTLTPTFGSLNKNGLSNERFGNLRN